MEKLMIVDDNPTHRFLIREAVEKNLDYYNNVNYAKLSEKEKNEVIIEANDGDEALILSYEIPDIKIMLLDINMPKDGIEVLMELRSNNIFDKMLIIMLTSSDLEIEISNSKELGANGFMVKPYNISGWNKKFDLFNKIFIKNESVSDNELHNNFLFVNKIQ